MEELGGDADDKQAESLTLLKKSILADVSKLIDNQNKLFVEQIAALRKDLMKTVN